MKKTEMIFSKDIIAKHPSADIPVDGVTSRLIQAGQQQFIFMEFNQDVEVPKHSHNAQWGVVLDGEMEITIDGQTLFLKKGDTYYIKKDAIHSAKIKKGYKQLTLFDQKDRYKEK
ncbi:cupin domain-containing protein [Fulvivirgaceae bacterium BMA10]|uniref:Cupin domain-containing protein n=1 Tax=Splendidivirga corallicola TaxID=3051826 RepID=A0ABT8KS88_9BACT|nr:cupin domain-containing protein [Fulvivirgaceae bacterium BMA10]